MPPLQAEQRRQLLLIQFRADDAEPSRVVGMTCANLMLLRHIVKLNPLAVLTAWVKFLGVSRPQEVNTSSA